MARWFVAENVTPEGLGIALQDPRFCWVYAERMEEVVLTWRDGFLEGTAPLERWTHGRAFGPDAELAWWRGGNHAEARAIVEGGEPPQGLPWTPYPEEDPEPVQKEGQEVLLVGEREEGDVQWSTARIPRYLPYPVEGAPRRVVLVRQAYRRNGVIVTWRLMEVRDAGEG